MSDIVIRDAKPTDINNLAELRLSLQRHVEASNPMIWRITAEGVGLLKQGLEEAMRADQDHIVVATMNGEVIGFVHGQVLQRTDYQPNIVGTISNIYVQREFRGRGIGRRLVEGLFQFFSVKNVEEVTLRFVIGNREAEEFWIGLGFKPVIKTANAHFRELEERLKHAEGVAVREFRARDVEAVKGLIDETIGVSYSQLPMEYREHLMERHHSRERIAEEARQGYTVVLEMGGKLIGTGTLLGNNIQRVYVHPSYQRRGFGKLIMRELESKASARGIMVLFLESTTVSKTFYDVLGYRTLEEASFSVGTEHNFRYYKMEKELVTGH
jgi:GNAT superfamily N-acetyltransferase